MVFLAQAEFSPQGGQYPVVGSLPGDQVSAQLALGSSGGLLVWQDNATDEDGLGIAARRISSSFTGTFGVFRVNENGVGDQENPQVALLPDGGAVFVWQGGINGASEIYARFVRADGTFATGDIQVNTSNSGPQTQPALAVLSHGEVVVAWSSFGQDGDQNGVYAQRLSSAGAKLGEEFQVNRTTSFNQRSPAVVGLADGNFVIAWVTEQYRTSAHVADPENGAAGLDAGAEIFRADVVATLYRPDGEALKTEQRLNGSDFNAANPSLTSLGPSGFGLAWSAYQEKLGGVTSSKTPKNGWDVFYRAFSPDLTPRGADLPINSYKSGDQFLPRLAAVGDDVMVVWSSLAQEGLWQGVYGQFLSVTSGQPVGKEFRVNTTTTGPQLNPAPAAMPGGHFVVVWSYPVGGVASYELGAQRYESSLQLVAPPAPYVSALSQTRLSVTWPEFDGVQVAGYELYLDNQPQPMAVTSNIKEVTQLMPGSSHSFRYAFVLPDGRRSPLSSETVGKTWGEDETFDGLPDDWQALYWGPDRAKWALPGVDSDRDGATDAQEFLAGTNPLDPKDSLKVRIAPGQQGALLVWNTKPGQVYQVQTTTDFISWVSHGTPRFAAGDSDAVSLEETASAAYYRVIRSR